MCNPTEGMKAPGISLQGNRHRQDWGKLFGETWTQHPAKSSCS